MIIKEEESSHLQNGVDYTRDVNVLYEDEDFEVKSEILNGVLFYHIYVGDFSLSTYKKMKKVWEELKRNAKDEGWDAIHSYTQNLSFVEKFGGSRIATVVGLTGDEYGVYRWELKQ